MEFQKSQSRRDSSVETARSFERIALEYYRKGFLEEASAAMRYALKQHPTASLWYNLGSILDELNCREEAVEAFEIALSIEPSLTPAYNNLGVVWARLGERKKSRAAFRQVLSAGTGSPADAFHRSAAYYNLGKTRHAVKAFVDAVHAFPELAGQFTDLHAALSQERRMESLLAKQGYSRVADPAVSGQSWFKWQLFDTGLFDFARALVRGDLSGMGLRPRRQVFVGAGMLTATALSPLLAFIPQSQIYKDIVEGGVFSQLTPQPSAVPQPAYVPPPVTSAQEQRQPTSQRWGPIGGVEETVAPPPPPRMSAPSVSSAPPSPMGGGVSSASGASSFSPVLGDSGATRSGGNNYNIRLGPVGMDITGTGSMEFNDNISSSEFNREQDLITTLGINMAATWEITRFNSIDLGIGASFSKYVNNTDLDSFNNFMTLSPDTYLDFNVQAGDVLFTFFDRLSYSINPLDTIIPGAPTTSVTKFARFSNSVGVNATWQGKQLNVTAGASRNDTLPQGKQFDFTHSSGYNFPLGFSYKLAKNKTVGANFFYSIQNSKGQTNGFKNNDRQMIGFSPNLEWALNPRLKLAASLGYSKVLSDNNGTSGDTSEDGTMTGSLFLSHTASSRYEHNLAISRGLDFGFTSNSIATTSVDYGFNWKLFRETSLNGGIGYQRGKESVGEDFNRYTGTLGMGYQLNKKTSFDISYSHAMKSSDQAGRSYHQNRVNFGVSYDF